MRSIANAEMAPCYVGIDGCPGGWVAVALSTDKDWSLGLEADLSTLLDSLPQARLVLIDMPIGLLQVGSEGRACDKAARRALGRGRASSVFPVPLRPALQASDYEEANRINRRHGGKGISCQSWNIVRKLRELDALMQASVFARQTLREAHPEVCFQALNRRRAMSHNKKTREGRLERETLLQRYFPALPALMAFADAHYRRKELARDDLLDATVLAVTALLGASALRTLPEVPEQDALGLPMEIVYFEP